MRRFHVKGHMAAPEFVSLFSEISKAALVDALWCACQLGTNETTEEISTQAARNVEIACRNRNDRISPGIRESAARRIDSDPEN